MKTTTFSRNFELNLVRYVLNDSIGVHLITLVIDDLLRISKDFFSLQKQFKERFKRAANESEIIEYGKEQIQKGKLKSTKNLELTIAESNQVEVMKKDFFIGQFLDKSRHYVTFECIEESYKLWKDGSLDQILPLITTGVHYGKRLELGRDGYILQPGSSDLKEVLDEIREDKLSVRRIPTGISALDKHIKGLGDAELGCILGAPGIGKTTFLLNIAYAAMMQGLTPVYFSFEVGEQTLMARLCALICNIPINSLHNAYYEVRNKVRKFFDKYQCGIVIKNFGSKGATIEDTSIYLEEFKQEHERLPSPIIYDYVDEVGAGGGEKAWSRYSELGDVCSDMRYVGHINHSPVWTASLVKREAWYAKYILDTDVGDSAKKIAVADLIMSICATAKERQNRRFRLLIPKCRWAEPFKEFGPYETGYDMGRFAMLGDGDGSMTEPEFEDDLIN